MNVWLATTSDCTVVLDLVSKLLVELGGSSLQMAKATPVFHDLITREDAGFVVLGKTDHAVSAVCTMSFLQALRSHGRYAIIQEMYVAPKERSTGIGTSVLRFALDHALAVGCCFVELGTPTECHRQIQFYERSGFVSVGARLRWTPRAS